MNIKLLHAIIDQLYLVITHHPIQNPTEQKTQKEEEEIVTIKTNKKEKIRKTGDNWVRGLTISSSPSLFVC
jgi:hypothetical protein